MSNNSLIKKNPAKTVAEYLSALPVVVHKTLESVRRAIKTAAPGAEELISYKIPFYKYKGHLAALFASKNHCSFVTMTVP